VDEEASQYCAKTRQFAVYASRPNPDVSLPEVSPPIRILRWEAKPFSPLPAEFRQLKGVHHLFNTVHLLFWRLHYLLRHGARRLFAIYFAFDGDRLIHYSVVRSRDFRFPFMKERDAQIGPVWTRPGDRRKGVAAEVGKRIVSDVAGNWDNVWWICRRENPVSCHTAVRIGLDYVGEGSHTTVMGFRVLGHYVLHAKIANPTSPKEELNAPRR